MRNDAKKLISKAKPEGTEEIWTIQCDICEPPDSPTGAIVAVLEWGDLSERTPLRYAPLNPELLQPSLQHHIQFEYKGEILIPDSLVEPPKRLTDKAFQSGFVRIA